MIVEIYVLINFISCLKFFFLEKKSQMNEVLTPKQKLLFSLIILNVVLEIFDAIFIISFGTMFLLDDSRTGWIIFYYYLTVIFYKNFKDFILSLSLMYFFYKMAIYAKLVKSNKLQKKRKQFSDQI